MIHKVAATISDFALYRITWGYLFFALYRFVRH